MELQGHGYSSLSSFTRPRPFTACLTGLWCAGMLVAILYLCHQIDYQTAPVVLVGICLIACGSGLVLNLILFCVPDVSYIPKYLGMMFFVSREDYGLVSETLLRGGPVILLLVAAAAVLHIAPIWRDVPGSRLALTLTLSLIPLSYMVVASKLNHFLCFFKS